MAKHKVCLDPGHSNKTIGAVGADGTKEGEVVLSVALRAGKYLEDNGIEVIYTRLDGSHRELYERAKIANDAKADLFISIHLDANSNRDANGTTTYCYKLGGPGEVLARNIHRELISSLRRFDRGVRAENFLVLRATKMPAILCELLFVSNLEEEDIIKQESNQEKAAYAIAKGIVATLGLELKEGYSNTNTNMSTNTNSNGNSNSNSSNSSNESTNSNNTSLILKYRLQAILKGEIKGDIPIYCYTEPSKTSRINGKLIKSIHSPVMVYAKVRNEEGEWYLVNITTLQWVSAEEIEVGI